MATIANVSTEKSSTNQSSFEVITLSSDEEQSEHSNEDVNFLFKRFILACRPHVGKGDIIDARALFTEVQGNVSHDHDLMDMLKRYGKEIKKENADLYLNIICGALSEKKSGNNSMVSSGNVGENIRDGNKVAKSVTFCDVSEARGFESTTKSSTNQNNNPATSTPEIATISDDDDFVSKKPSTKSTERTENKPSTSSANQDSKADKTKGKISTKTLTTKQKKKLAARLKQRLKEISNEIKILNRAELTLDEMDMCDSTYIQENRLKKKFEKTWNKLCKILGREPNTGRVVEKPIRASSTGYSLIDKAVGKFLKERNSSFPDYFDIRDIVLKTNQKHDLRMSPQVLNGLIADIFTDIGNKLQRRRERDLLFNFGSHLLDDFKTEEDPALTNEDLAMQLEKNRRISKRNLKHVYAKYTHLERYEIDDKSRKYGSSRVNRDTSDESGTSDDEQDDQRSRNHKYARLNRQEVMGKSKMKKESSDTPGSSRGIDRDISSEFSSSDNEQDLSGMVNDNSIVVEDSDVPTSQELSFITPSPKFSTDMSLSTSRVEQSLSDADDMEVSLSDNNRPESPIFPLTCPIIKQNETGRSGQTTLDSDCSNNDTQTNQQTFSSSSDCEIIYSPNEQKQLVTLANEPLVSKNQAYSGYDCEIVDEPTEQLVTIEQQLDEPVNEPSVSDKQSNTDDDCEIVDKPTEQLVTMKQLDEPVNEPSVSDKQQNTDDDCEIVNDPKQLSVTITQLERPDSVNEPHIDDCLIIDDDQEDPPTTSCSEPLKIPTSTPSDELTKTLNALREVFRKRSHPVDQSNILTSTCDKSTESRNTNSVSKTAPDRFCSSEDSTSKNNVEDLNLKSGNSVLSQTNTSKAGSSKSSGDNIGDLDPKPECVTFITDNDITMSDNDQCSTSDSAKDSMGIITCPPSPEIETNHTIASTTSNSPPKHSEANQLSQSTEACTNVVVSSITSNSRHSPSSPSNVVNSRKRKATTELAVHIPKKSVKCLEQIAWCLKNKKLKLPDAWVNTKKAEKNSNVSPSKPTTSKESSTTLSNVPSVSSFAPTSEGSSTVTGNVPSAALSIPTSEGSSTVSQTSSENNSKLANGKTKLIDLQHRQVFREKTLNALKAPTNKTCNNNVNGAFQSNDISSSVPPASDDNEDRREVIIIDD